MAAILARHLHIIPAAAGPSVARVPETVPWEMHETNIAMNRNTLTSLAPIDAPAVTESAAVIYANSFETGLSDWDAYGGSFNATRVASGTNGIVSATGGFHAESSPSGSASRWGGYNFGAGAGVPTPFQEYSTSVAIYLDVSGEWANQTRFDFSSAINRADGNFWRDFVFNAGFYTAADALGPGAGTKRFVISASNYGQPADADPKNPDQGPRGRSVFR
jgi:hypothetical protein